MNEATWNRWSLLSGAIFVVLVAIAVVLVGQYEHLPPVDELANFCPHETPCTLHMTNQRM